MKTVDIKVGESFSINGETYEKTKEGIKSLSTGSIVPNVSGEVVLEKRLING